MLKSKKCFIPLLIFIILIITSFNSYAYDFKQTDKKLEVDTDLSTLIYDIVIPKNFSSIQQGINNAKPGQTIFVRSGVYNEHITIDKNDLHLIGENKYNTIIDIENNDPDAVIISGNNVSVEGFTVTNARSPIDKLWNQSGFVIISSNVTIKDNIISENRWGLMSYTTAFNLTICDNIFIHDGIFPASYIPCHGNDRKCKDSIPKESILINVTNNTVNGRPLYFYKNVQNKIIEQDAGQVVLANCTNITVKNQYFSKIDFSIMLYFCSNCTVENNTIADVEGELILFFSENNTIQNNDISNAFHAICLDIGAKNNIVRYNNIHDNLQGITIISGCSGNKVYKNKIKNNGWGMKVTSYTENLPSYNNYIYENEVSENTIGINLLPSFNSLTYTKNNTISKNTFYKNKIGLQLYYSEGNKVINNTFRKNILSATFIDCKQNFWFNNYWNKPRILPKTIIGFKMLGKIPFPFWLNFDKNPALEPYET